MGNPLQRAPRSRSHLERLRLDHAVVSHTPTQTLREAATVAHIDTHDIARTVLLQDSRGLLLTVLPANHLIDFHALRELLGSDCKPAPAEQVMKVFTDCETGSVPPLGEPYDMPVMIDTYFAHCNNIYLEAGCPHTLLRICGDNFGQFHQASMHATVSRPLGILDNRDVREFMLSDDIQ